MLFAIGIYISIIIFISKRQMLGNVDGLSSCRTREWLIIFMQYSIILCTKTCTKWDLCFEAECVILYQCVFRNYDFIYSFYVRRNICSNLLDIDLIAFWVFSVKSNLSYPIRVLYFSFFSSKYIMQIIKLQIEVRDYIRIKTEYFMLILNSLPSGKFSFA